MGTDYTCTEKGNTDLQTLKKKKKKNNTKIGCNIEISHDNVNLTLTFIFHP